MWPEDLPLLPKAASTLASRIDALTATWLAISVFFSVLIAVLLIAFAIRYRRRSDDETGEFYSAPTWVEVAWCVVPFVLMLGLFGWGAAIYLDAFRPPATAVEYYVIAKQWMWKFQHPEGHREINQLHVPAGQPVKLIMTSQDVIHSFYVPAFRVKRDVVPGRYTTVWFEATEPGTYRLFCAEYCGAEHSLMGGSVVVLSPTDYERWLLDEGAATPPFMPGESVPTGGRSMADAGEELFTAKACIGCHRSDSAAVAPMMQGLHGSREEMADGEIVLVDEAYLRESILEPQARLVKGYAPVMPTYQGQLSEEELLALIEYIKSLADEGASGAAGADAGTTSEGATEDTP